MPQVIEFFVPGLPKTAGSKRVFLNKKTGRPMVTDTSGKKGKDWRIDIQRAAWQAYDGPPLIVPLSVTLAFRLPRPKAHYGTGKNAAVLKESAPRRHIVRPDIDKLSRAVLDALKGVVWRDDAQVWAKSAMKGYADGEPPGVRVQVRCAEAADDTH